MMVTEILRGFGVVGWCDGRGYTSSAGGPTIWMIVGQGPIALAVGAGGGCLDIFYCPLSFLSSFSVSLGARYRLKYCLKGGLKLEQPTNQLKSRLICEQELFCIMVTEIIQTTDGDFKTT